MYIFSIILGLYREFACSVLCGGECSGPSGHTDGRCLHSLLREVREWQNTQHQCSLYYTVLVIKFPCDLLWLSLMSFHGFLTIYFGILCWFLVYTCRLANCFNLSELWRSTIQTQREDLCWLMGWDSLQNVKQSVSIDKTWFKKFLNMIIHSYLLIFWHMK